MTFFKKEKIYELEDEPFDISGFHSDVYVIKNKKRLIAKVMRHKSNQYQLTKDLEFYNLLKREKISIPRMVGIRNVSLNGEIKKALIMEVIKDAVLIKSYHNGDTRGCELLKLEFEKIEKLPFTIRTSDIQGLYSKLNDKSSAHARVIHTECKQIRNISTKTKRERVK